MTREEIKNDRDQRCEQLVASGMSGKLAESFYYYQQVAALVPTPSMINTAPVRYSNHSNG